MIEIGITDTKISLIGDFDEMFELVIDAEDGSIGQMVSQDSSQEDIDDAWIHHNIYCRLLHKIEAHRQKFSKQGKI
jgi:hypothetical protein